MKKEAAALPDWVDEVEGGGMMTKHFSDFDSGAYYEQKCRNLEDKLSTANQRILKLEALMVPGGFPSDVMTAAGLVYHGKRDELLAALKGMIQVTDEDLQIFRASRSASPVGAFMREHLAAPPSPRSKEYTTDDR